MGPLQGIKILEIAGIGPGQYCGMLLADMGADLIRLYRKQPDDDPGVGIPARFNLMNRSRPGVAIDLKDGTDVELVLSLCEKADGIFEGFRPGVAERLSVGPDACLARNPKLVYGRMTGWGQEGPLARTAGHDTNYIALAGALGAIGDADRPPPLPLNLLGDFGGGGVFLALGMVAAILEAQRSGKGQVVDAAMVDGVASMMTLFYGLMAGGLWQDQRQSNFLDGAAPYARCYRTIDNKFVAVCAIESRFYRELLEKLEIDDIDPVDQNNISAWPELGRRFEECFATRSRNEWCDVFAGSDACFAPVLSIGEAPKHEHLSSRSTFVSVDGIEQPAPAPRFSRTPSEIKHAPKVSDMENALHEWGLSEADIQNIVNSRH